MGFLKSWYGQLQTADMAILKKLISLATFPQKTYTY